MKVNKIEGGGLEVAQIKDFLMQVMQKIHLIN